MSNLNSQANLLQTIREEARKAAEAVYNERGTQFGVPTTPYHIHNGVDAPAIPPLNISTFSPLGDTARVAIESTQTINSDATNNISGAERIPTPLLPVIYGNGVGTASQFQGGVGEAGQVILFTTPALVHQLWAYIDDNWYGVDLDSTPGGGSASVPSGSIMPFGGSSAPTGYLLCDGSAVSRTTYSTLFGVISTTYGVGNGSTTFNVPDLRANVPAGFKSGDANFGTLGGAVGEATHTLSVSEMPSHSHPGSYSSLVWNTNGANSNNENTAGSTVTSVTPGIVPQGGGGAHNNIQPSLTINYVIKT